MTKAQFFHPSIHPASQPSLICIPFSFQPNAKKKNKKKEGRKGKSVEAE
jgi:hypothetical protein